MNASTFDFRLYLYLNICIMTLYTKNKHFITSQNEPEQPFILSELKPFFAQTKKCHSPKVGSSCFMCWGTLSTTFDILALLGIYQKKRKLLLPWLVWYMLEVVAVVGLVMMSTVYSDSDTLYLLPVLVKPLVTIFAWFNVRYVYKSSLRKFYSRNLSYY